MQVLKLSDNYSEILSTPSIYLNFVSPLSQSIHHIQHTVHIQTKRHFVYPDLFYTRNQFTLADAHTIPWKQTLAIGIAFTIYTLLYG